MVSQLHYQHRQSKRLSRELSISVIYHDIFDYPLKEAELQKWQSGKRLRIVRARPRVGIYENFYFIQGNDELVNLRESKERESREKMKLLSRAKYIFEDNRDILFVGITGSLAMNSASADSDIDLMVITKAGKLWQTRLRTLLTLKKMNIKTRRAGESDETDKLCINIWMDERDLKVKRKSPYTAHEIAQIIPLVNRGGAYSRLLWENKWILDFWPNSVEVKEDFSDKVEGKNGLGERLAFAIQYIYMKRKMTREKVTATRAFFHPLDWGKKVDRELAKRGVVSV